MIAPLKLIKQIFSPIIVFQSVLGPRIYFGFLLIFLSGVFEIVGIMMLMPLLQIIIGNGTDVHQSTSQGQLEIFGADVFGVFESAPAESLLVIIVIAFFAKGLFTFCAYAYIAYLKGELSVFLKGESVRAVFETDYRHLMAINFGALTNVIGEQSNRALIAFNQLSLTISQVIISFLYLAVAFLLAPTFGALVAFAGILMFALFRLLNVRVNRISAEFTTQSGGLQRHLNDLIFSQKYLRATQAQSYALNKAQNVIDSTARLHVRMGFFAAITQAIREPVAVSVLSLLILLVLMAGAVDIGAVFIALILYYRGLNSILTTQSFLQATLEYMGSAHKVLRRLESLKKNTPEQVDLIPINNWQLIHASNLSFEYVPGVPVLKDISFQINRNQVVGIVGGSGSGKTTMVDLIAGLMPSSLMVDDLPLSKVRDWGELIGYVSQDVMLMDGSVQENITLQASSEVDHKALYEAVEAAQLNAVIEKLPCGLNSMVVDQGSGYSGGERQRILIARALYRQPKLLIFDEATSALDNETELSLRQSLEALKGKLTILLVAHRLSTVKFCDDIIVLDNGELIESGSYIKLSSDINSKFSKLISAETHGA